MGKLTAVTASNNILPLHPTGDARILKNYNQNASYFNNFNFKKSLLGVLAQIKAAANLRNYRVRSKPADSSVSTLQTLRSFTKCSFLRPQKRI